MSISSNFLFYPTTPLSPKYYELVRASDKYHYAQESCTVTREICAFSLCKFIVRRWHWRYEHTMTARSFPKFPVLSYYLSCSFAV